MASTEGLRDCAVTQRAFVGPYATELFVHVSPTNLAPAASQARVLYRELAAVLARHGGDPGHGVRHTVFYRDAAADSESVGHARRDHAAEHGVRWRAAVTDIQQPPLNPAAAIECLLHAVIPTRSAGGGERPTSVMRTEDDDPGDVAHLHVGLDQRLYVGNLAGEGDTMAAQVAAVFQRAEGILHKSNLQFGHVARTWIYLRDIDADYAQLNRTRREFFDRHDLPSVPASTGIAGGPTILPSKIAMGLYAVTRDGGLKRTVMTSPTLNEASSYGADFVRGVRLDESNRTALHVSGTASVDEHGATVHAGDIAAQAKRMLLNIETLLAGQGATMRDIVSATTYLKHPEDAEVLKACFAEAGFVGFPNPLVAAPVCRPDLLCETELLALLPAARSGQA